MISPDQELFDCIMIASQDYGFETYDHLPLETENASYPFVEIGDIQQLNLPNKTALGARFIVNLNVWGDNEMRLDVSQMSDCLSSLANHVLLTDHYRFVGRPGQTDKQILNDTSVENTVLKHGILTLVFDLE